MEQKEIKKHLSFYHLMMIPAVCQRFFQCISAVIEVEVRESLWCDCRASWSSVSGNRTGPDTEPWGTPVSRKQGLDKEPFHVTWQVRFVRYDVNQVRAESAMFSKSGEENLVVDCQTQKIIRGEWGMTSWTRFWRLRTTQSLWAGLSEVSGPEAGLIWVKEVPGFSRGMKEEIQVCSFRCQLSPGWVSVGAALLWLCWGAGGLKSGRSWSERWGMAGCHERCFGEGRRESGPKNRCWPG